MWRKVWEFQSMVVNKGKESKTISIFDYFPNPYIYNYFNQLS